MVKFLASLLILLFAFSVSSAASLEQEERLREFQIKYEKLKKEGELEARLMDPKTMNSTCRRLCGNIFSYTSYRVAPDVEKNSYFIIFGCKETDYFFTEDKPVPLSIDKKKVNEFIRYECYNVMKINFDSSS